MTVAVEKSAQILANVQWTNRSTLTNVLKLGGVGALWLLFERFAALGFRESLLSGDDEISHSRILDASESVLGLGSLGWRHQVLDGDEELDSAGPASPLMIFVFEECGSNLGNHEGVGDAIFLNGRALDFGSGPLALHGLWEARALDENNSQYGSGRRWRWA